MLRVITRVRGVKYKLVDLYWRWLFMCFVFMVGIFFMITLTIDHLPLSAGRFLILFLIAIILMVLIKRDYAGLREWWDRWNIDRLDDKWSDKGWHKYTKKQREAIEDRAGLIMFQDDMVRWGDSCNGLRIVRTCKYYYVFLLR